MPEKGLFLQNVIAVIWDFDKTLSPQYMQKPLFDAYDVDEQRFWAEVNALPAYYAKAGVTVQQDTSYLGHLLSYVQSGRMPDLTNARLRELGADIEFFPGIPELFERLANLARISPFDEWDLHLEHYVVSTGIAEMVRGSRIAPYLSGIHASEFIEVPAGPGTDFAGSPQTGPISQIAGFLDNTTKTRALFEINKGVNKAGISVNDAIPEDERRVPFKNMIYIADGPSDIPSFSVVKKHNGHTCAVYTPGSAKHFEQAKRLQDTDRVDHVAPADYREGTQVSMWLEAVVKEIAGRMVEERKRAFQSKVSPGPTHVTDEEKK
ncbi:MAG: haloacid dehalogenase-like hydrolase [Candidatus Hydrogenedentes bacterium]|nr:haloacid dehalogenase-like hydrolase [Candidatus Hydrogenedentota bacterium]